MASEHPRSTHRSHWMDNRHAVRLRWRTPGTRQRAGDRYRGVVPRPRRRRRRCFVGGSEPGAAAVRLTLRARTAAGTPITARLPDNGYRTSAEIHDETTRGWRPNTKRSTTMPGG